MTKRNPRFSINNWELATITSTIYLVIGLLWVFLSDKIVAYHYEDIEKVQTIKGILFILCSSIVIFLLVYGQMRLRNKPLETLSKNNLLLNSIFNQHSDLYALLVNKSGIVTQSYGTGIMEMNLLGKDIVGKSLYSYPDNKIDKDQLLNFIQKIWEGEIQELKIHKNENSFYLKGMLISDSNTGTQIAVITIRNITSSVEYSKKIDNLQSQCKNLTKHLQYYKKQTKQLSTVLDQSCQGIIVLSTSIYGVAIEATYINDVAKSILQLTQTMDLQESKESGAKQSIQQLLQHNFLSSDTLNNSFVVESNGDLKTINLSSRYQRESSSITVELDEVKQEHNIVEAVTSFNEIYSILNSISDGAILISPEGRCVFFNDAMIELFQLKIENNHEMSMIELMAMSGDIDSSEMINKALQGEIVETNDYNIVNDKTRKLRSVFYPLFNLDKEVISVLRLTYIVHTDEDKTSIQNTNISLEKVMQMKILPIFSHEIRTALNSIMGSSELLENYSTNEEQREYVKLIKRSGEDLSIMLESFRLISLLKSHSLVPNMGWFTISDLIKNIQTEVDAIKARHSKQDLKVHFTVLPEIKNYKIRNDQESLVQILIRLIDNAIKYTLEGSVEIGFNSLNNNGQLEIWVKDTGIGINSIDIHSIFIPFSPITNSERGVIGGIGTGLAIVKELTELLSGTIEVESALDKGTKFTLNIPITNRNNLAKTETASITSTIKILIVQYGYVFNHEIKSYLKENQIKVFNANNGADAIELLAQHKDITIIFTDIRHSDMNGLEFLKAAKRILPNVIAIAQAPYLIPEEKNELLNNGFDDYLVKPIYNAQFIQTIEKFTQDIYNT